MLTGVTSGPKRTPGSYPCRICSKVFTRLDKRNSHETKSINGKCRTYGECHASSSFAVANLVAAPRKVHSVIQEGKGPHEDDRTCRHCEVQFHSKDSRQRHERRKILGQDCHTQPSRLYSNRKVKGW